MSLYTVHEVCSRTLQGSPSFARRSNATRRRRLPRSRSLMRNDRPFCRGMSLLSMRWERTHIFSRICAAGPCSV